MKRISFVKYHYVVSNGSSGYAYGKKDLSLTVEMYNERGQKVYIFKKISAKKSKALNWRVRAESRG